MRRTNMYIVIRGICFFFFGALGLNLTILGQQKHSKSSAGVSSCEPDAAGEDVQEEMPLRAIITSVGLQP